MAKIATTIALLISVHFAFVSSVSADGTIYYDAPTGEMFFEVDTPGTGITAFELRSNSSQLIHSQYQRLGGSTTLFKTSATTITDHAGFGTEKPEGLYSLGAIYPSNMTLDDLIADLTGGYGVGVTPHSFVFELGRPIGTPINDVRLAPLTDDAWATAATLEYNEGSGELTLVADGYLTSLGLKPSATSVWHGDAFGIADADTKTGFDGSYYYSMGLLEPGEYSLGALLEAGLSSDQFVGAFDGAKYLGQAGVGASNFDFATADSALSLRMVHVPEPSFGAFSVLCVALFGLRCRVGKSLFRLAA